MNNEKQLKEFLATGKNTAKEQEAQDAAMEIAIIVEGRDVMRTIISRMIAVEMLAKDLHYRAGGKSFYAIHLLSDMVWEVRHCRDELNEIYYLGEKGGVPPLQSKVYEAAVRLVNADCASGICASEEGLINLLRTTCLNLVDLIERAKKEVELKSGTIAVLDDISKKMLSSAGQLGRSLSQPNEDPENIVG